MAAINKDAPTISAVTGSLIFKIEIPRRDPGIRIKTKTVTVVPKTSDNCPLSRIPGKKIKNEEASHRIVRTTRLLLFFSVLSTSQL